MPGSSRCNFCDPPGSGKCQPCYGTGHGLTHGEVSGLFWDRQVLYVQRNGTKCFLHRLPARVDQGISGIFKRKSAS